MTQPQQDDRQILIDDAFPVYQKRCAELFEENMLLRSQVAGLKRQVGELRQLVPAQDSPAPAAPDLAAVPPYPGPDPA